MDAACESETCAQENRLPLRHDIPFGAEPEIDRLSRAVDRAIEVGPEALDLRAGFVDAPRGAGSGARSGRSAVQTPEHGAGPSA